MKLASEHSGGLVQGLTALSLNFPANKYRPLLRPALVGGVLAIGALLLDFLLPARLVLLFQDMACWGFVGAVGVLTLLVTVKIIEGLLDS